MEDDVINYIHGEDTINTYISLLVDEFMEPQEITELQNHPDNQGMNPVIFRKKWAKMYKSEYREYLKPYLVEVNSIFDSFKIMYDVVFADAGEGEYYASVDFMENSLLLSHDAYHLAVCKNSDIPFIKSRQKTPSIIFDLGGEVHFSGQLLPVL